jgi:hypothetical protein
MTPKTSIPILLAGLVLLAGCRDEVTPPSEAPPSRSAVGSPAFDATRPDPIQAYLSRNAAHRQRRTEYVQHLGRAARVPEMIRLLRASGAYDRAPGPIREFLLERAAQHLAIRGYTPDRMRRFSSQGIDVAKAATAGPEATLAQTALLSDVVLRGEVVEYRNDARPDDGFHSSVVFRVHEVLKGEGVPAEIILRQTTGRTSDGTHLVRHGDIKPAVGDQYLLFLTNAEHRYKVYLHGASLSGAEQSRYYLPLRTPYRIEGDQLIQDVHGTPPGQTRWSAARQQISDLVQRMRED